MIASLIDTNVLIYSTLSRDPRYERARAVVLGPDERWGRRLVATQNLAEMYPNLTGPKMSTPDPPRLASGKVAAVARLPHLVVLPVTAAVVERALELCARHGILRQDYFDAQLFALVLEHGLARVYTENTDAFASLASDSGVEIVNPFT